MSMTEVARLLLGLRAAGWSDKEINDFILYIETSEEQYKPKLKEKRMNNTLRKNDFSAVLPF